MKKSQMFIRMMMAIVIMFGVETTAQAQFGSLLKKAKQAVKDKVDSEEYRAKAKVRDKVDDAENKAVNKTVTKTIGSSVDVENDDYGSNDYYRKLNEEAEQEKKAKAAAKKTTTLSSTSSTASKPAEKVLARIAPGEPGEVTIKNRKTGKVLATYDREACELKIAGGPTLLFQTDGTVADANGAKLGSIDGQTFTTPRGEQIRCDEIGIMFVDKKNVGSIQNQKMAILGDGTFIDASDKMNGVVLAYFVFGVMHSNKQLVAIKDGYENATSVDKYTDEEWFAHLNKEADKRHGSLLESAGGSEMSLRKGGSIVGRILADGTVYVGGSIKGKMDGQGNIYVGGHIEGTIRNNEILKNGHVVGTIDDDGTVRLNGHIVGGIDPRTGDVRRDGSIIGKVEHLTDIKKAAVFYFFGFY